MNDVGNAPITEKVDLPANQIGIAVSWRKWFETISASFAKYESITYVGNVTLTKKDFGKIVKMNNGASSVFCYLPSIGIEDIDSWITVMRLGTGKVTILGADADSIEKSALGGKIVCDEAARVLANITLMVASETKWAILAGTGIWKVY